MTTPRNATLTLDGQSYEFLRPDRQDTSPDVVEIRSLYAKSGAFTFDPGFMSIRHPVSRPSPTSMATRAS